MQMESPLIAVYRMLNILPATSHFQYAKSARLYLQRMLNLPEKYPWLCDQFCQHGFHTVRTARYWTDLTIEGRGRCGIKRPWNDVSSISSVDSNVQC